jgi:endonuclease YncB( thermonuclease family)
MGIDAEERKEDHGPRATAHLRSIVSSTPHLRSIVSSTPHLRSIVSSTPRIQCIPSDNRTYGRIVATCYTADGRDIAMLMVSGGYALDCERYSKGRYRPFEPPGARQTLAQKPYCNTRKEKQ